jgi:DNA gyrase subunit A
MEPSTAFIHIEDEMQQSYMDYAMSVIVGRALPDVRDGLKPVQRRILYAMFREGLLHNRKHSKCAGVVGEVLKKYHPHGDSSVYDALVRLAQPWSMRNPLVDGQGNFGSIDGDPAAAYRYTESRMTFIAERLLEDIDKDTVEFMPNFDDTNFEPVVLPTRFPNLLVNGADGIAVGMATHIAPHNISEVLNATIALVENPSLGVSDMMRHITGPDFPTGGVILGRSAIQKAYHTGRGLIRLRGRAEFETLKANNREVTAIIIREVPFQVNKAQLIEKIANLVGEKSVEGISKLRDESDRTGMRIVIELKRDAVPEIVLNHLYKLTPLQSTFGIINLAIVEGRPVVCSLVQLLKHFIDHRRDVVTRRTQFELRKADERMHLLEGFRIALLNLDEVISIIKGSETPRIARDALITRFELSEIQSTAILELRLQKLTGMERLAIEREHAELAAEIERLRALLASREKIDALIGSELKEMRELFSEERRTSIIEEEGEIDYEDLIEDEEMVVTISRLGYIKRIASDTYRAQHRGGKGVMGTAVKDDDYSENLFVASSLSDLLIFTTEGRLYTKKVYQLPEAGRLARGRNLVNLLDLRGEEKVSAVRPVKEFIEGRFIVLVTRQGIVKRMSLMDITDRRSGIYVCTLLEGDALIGVGISHGEDDVILATKNGFAIRFHEGDARVMGRSARGVKAITLQDGDEVVSMSVISQANEEEADAGEGRVDGEQTLLTICENGYGKRTRLSGYRPQLRGGKGLIDIRTSERNGSVVGALTVDDESEVMIITSTGKIIRTPCNEISVVGRNTQGVKLVNREEGDRVVAITKIAAGEPIENGEENGDDQSGALH